MRFMAFSLCSFVLSMAAACDTSESDGDGSADTSDGSSDTGDQDLCATDDPSPNTIAETQVNTAYPDPAGGTLEDGVYLMSRFEVYAPAMADAHVRSERLTVDAGTLVSTKQNDQDPVETVGGTVAAAGTMLELALSCPVAGNGELPFTAADGELWLFDPTEPNIKVYTRQ